MDSLFETKRLIVRRFTREDIPDILALIAHPSVARETPNVPRDAASLADYVEKQSGFELFATKVCVDLAIERRSDRKVIGMLSLVNDGARQAEIGWALGIDDRGHGFATEAARGLVSYGFAEHGFHRMTAETTHINAPSWRVMERLGMRKEAHFVQAHAPNEPADPWIDSVRYAVLASEWPSAGDRPRSGGPA